MEDALKIVITGETGVGKTQLYRLWTGDTFVEAHRPTSGVSMKTVEAMSGDQMYRIQLCDTPSDEDRDVNEMNFAGAAGAVIAFSIGSKRSLDAVNKWVDEVEEFAGKVRLFLVGTKRDLSEREVTEAEAKMKAAAVNALYFETSALMSDAVGQTLTRVMRYTVDSEGFNNMIEKQLKETTPSAELESPPNDTPAPAVHKNNARKRDRDDNDTRGHKSSTDGGCCNCA